MIYIYRLFINLVFILSPIIILIRLLKKKEDPKRIKEKFCKFTKERKKGKLIWIHVASVGEMLSVVPLIKKFEKKKKINQILLTSSTLSSANLFKKKKFSKTIHQFFPIDTNFHTKKFLNYWKPSLAIFIESEIWPNMILNLKNKSIKHILLNARITKRSFKNWKKVKTLSENLFGNFHSVYPQNSESEFFLKRLGSKKIVFLGNLKFSNTNEPTKNILNKKIYKNKKIWCASSTHPGEEIIAARTHFNLKNTVQNILTIIIPRHIDRTQKIISEIEKLGLNSQLFSSSKKINLDTDIYIVDAYGETKNFFKISKLVFLGGSLINHGGQNPLEAARFGCKIVHGKYIDNFKEVYSLLKINKQSTKIKSQRQLDFIVKKSLADKNKSNIFINKLKIIGNKILEKNEKEIVKLI